MKPNIEDLNYLSVFSKGDLDRLQNVICEMLKTVSDDFTLSDTYMALHKIIDLALYEYDIEKNL